MRGRLGDGGGMNSSPRIRRYATEVIPNRPRVAGDLVPI